jgi:hypothetical protein
LSDGSLQVGDCRCRVGPLVAVWLPPVGRQVDGRWLRLRVPIVRSRRLRAARSTLVHDTPSQQA